MVGFRRGGNGFAFRFGLDRDGSGFDRYGFELSDEGLEVSEYGGDFRELRECIAVAPECVNEPGSDTLEAENGAIGLCPV
jgi:hypothetical protein